MCCHHMLHHQRIIASPSTTCPISVERQSVSHKIDHTHRQWHEHVCVAQRGGCCVLTSIRIKRSGHMAHLD